MASYIMILALLATAASLAFAADPSPLQDFCVGIKRPDVFVNGQPCKDPKTAVADDFFFEGLDKSGSTNNSLGSNAILVNADKIPGLNTLGISLSRIDFAPFGLNPLHFHPRASEIITVLEGTLYVGFVASDPDNKFFPKVLHKGDVFVFPQGLIHFQFNPSHSAAVAIAGFGSQNPGSVTIANAVFGSDPPIDPNVIAKAFKLDAKTVKELQAKFRANMS